MAGRVAAGLLVLAAAALVATAQAAGAGAVPTVLREHAADAAEPASAAAAVGCTKAAAVALVDGCPAAGAGPPSAAQVCPFEQVRLTAGEWDGADGQWWMSVSFATTPATIGASKPAVRMSNTAGTLDGDGEEGCVLVFTGTTTAYSYVSAGGPFFSEQTKYYQSPKIHHVDVGPLQPGTEYYYQVGRAAAPDSPELYRDTVFSFRTPPAPGAVPTAQGESWKAGATKTGDVMTIYMMGDSGQTQFANQTYVSVKERSATSSAALAVILGDMAYADGDGCVCVCARARACGGKGLCVLFVYFLSLSLSLSLVYSLTHSHTHTHTHTGTVGTRGGGWWSRRLRACRSWCCRATTRSTTTPTQPCPSGPTARASACPQSCQRKSRP